VYATNESENVRRTRRRRAERNSRPRGYYYFVSPTRRCHGTKKRRRRFKNKRVSVARWVGMGERRRRRRTHINTHTNGRALNALCVARPYVDDFTVLLFSSLPPLAPHSCVRAADVSPTRKTGLAATSFRFPPQSSTTTHRPSSPGRVYQLVRVRRRCRAAAYRSLEPDGSRDERLRRQRRSPDDDDDDDERSALLYRVRDDYYRIGHHCGGRGR